MVYHKRQLGVRTVTAAVTVPKGDLGQPRDVLVMHEMLFLSLNTRNILTLRTKKTELFLFFNLILSEHLATEEGSKNGTFEIYPSMMARTTFEDSVSCDKGFFSLR